MSRFGTPSIQGVPSLFDRARSITGESFTDQAFGSGSDSTRAAAEAQGFRVRGDVAERGLGRSGTGFGGPEAVERVSLLDPRFAGGAGGAGGPSFTDQVFGAAFTDAEAIQGAADRQRERVDGAIGDVREAVGRNAGDLRERAEAGSDEVRAFVEDSLEQVRGRFDDVLGGIRDLSAQQTAVAASQIDQNAKSTLAAINSDPNMTEQQKRDAKAQIAGETSRSRTAAYTEFASRFNELRATTAANLAGVEAQTVVGLSNTLNVANQVEGARFIEAAQFEVQGLGAVAELIRGNPETVVPLLPIFLQTAEIQAAQLATGTTLPPINTGSLI